MLLSRDSVVLHPVFCHRCPVSIVKIRIVTMSDIEFDELPPTLNEFESTATVGVRSESLSEIEFEILSQLLRYPEQPLTREALKRVAGYEDDAVSDRRLDAWLTTLARKTNVLWPKFPVLRFVSPDSYIYTSKPPLKKRG